MSQKTDGMIKLALVFFVCLLSFSVGTYIGKKYSDNQHKLAMLEPQTPKATEAAAHADEFASDHEAHAAPAATAPENTETMLPTEEVATDDHSADNEEPVVANTQKPAALTDAEVAKLAAEFANDEAADAEKKVDVISEKGVKVEEREPASIPAKKEINKPAPAAAVAKANIKTEASAPVEKIPAKKDIETIHYTVQVGAYPTEVEAMSITNELLGKGYKTSYVPAKVNGKTWYRVSVGLFGSFKEAEDYKKSFLAKTKLSSAIIQRVE